MKYLLLLLLFLSLSIRTFAQPDEIKRIMEKAKSGEDLTQQEEATFEKWIDDMAAKAASNKNPAGPASKSGCKKADCPTLNATPLKLTELTCDSYVALAKGLLAIHGPKTGDLPGLKSMLENSEKPFWQFFGWLIWLGASKPTETPKGGFNYEKWKSVDKKLRECFPIPGQKEELGNGIDRYNSELIVVYNPERPPYYLPIKFRELAELAIEYWKLHPDKLQSDMMTKMMEDEYAKIPEAEHNGWAYNNTYDEQCPALQITPIPGPQPVVRLNPEYWDKKLPRSAIQILTFNRLTDTKRYTIDKAEALKYNSNGYNLSRFLEALDINLFTGLIEK